MSKYCSTSKRDIHVRIKLNGSVEKREFFHWVVGGLDRDWPWCPKSLKLTSSVAEPYYCTVCQGIEWRNPNLREPAIKAIAAQINSYPGLPGHLKIKFRHFAEAPSCCKDVRVGGMV